MHGYDESNVILAFLLRAVFGILIEAAIVYAVWPHAPNLNSLNGPFTLLKSIGRTTEQVVFFIVSFFLCLLDLLNE